MLRRGLVSILALLLIATTTLMPRTNAAQDDIVEGQSDPREQLLDQIRGNDLSNEEIARRLPELTVLASGDDTDAAELAVYALARIGKIPLSAVDGLYKRLGDSNHQTRSRAVDGLVLVGPAAIEPLRSIMAHNHGRKRAAAVTALARMQALSAEEFEQLANDPDPRIRAAVATALVYAAKAGIPLLTRLAADTNTGVALCAIEALGINRDDPGKAVPVLTSLLSEKDRDHQALESLRLYGIDARSAIPAILQRASATADQSASAPYSLRITLDRIGPPDERDLDGLRNLLFHPAVQMREMAADCLRRLGSRAASVLPDLERAFGNTSQQLIEASGRCFEDEGRVVLCQDAASSILCAIWCVSHDFKRTIALVEQYASQTNLTLDLRACADEPTIDNVRLLAPILASPNPDTILSGLTCVEEMKSRAEGLKEIVAALVSCEKRFPGEKGEEVSSSAWQTLESMGVSSAPELQKILLERLRSGTVTSEVAVPLLGDCCPDADLSDFFEKSLLSLEGESRQIVVYGLIRVCTNEDRATSILLQEIEAEKFPKEAAVYAFNEMVALNSDGVSFLKSQLNHEELSIQITALDALMRLGPRETVTIDTLRSLAESNSRQLRRLALAALFLWYDDSTEFQVELARAFATDEVTDHRDCLQRIVGMKEKGIRFSSEVLKESRLVGKPGFENAHELVVEALATVRTDKAIAALRELSSSTDWKLRCLATAALKRIESATTADSMTSKSD